MALPQQLKTARMTDSTAAATIDNEIGNLEQAIADILGIPVNTNINAALTEVVAAGLKSLLLQDAAADPTSTFNLRRNGARLKFHDGTSVKTLAHLDEITGFGGIFGSIGQTSKNNAGTPNTQYDLDADVVILRHATDPIIVRFNPGAAITNNISTAGPAANGRDQAGAFSNSSWLHFYWIWNPSTSTLATLSSAVAPPTGPTLPSGYTYWTYAGAVRLDGSGNLVRTLIHGAHAFYEAGINVVASGNAAVETVVDISGQVPPNALAVDLGIRVHANLNAGADPVTLTIRIVSGSNFQNLQGRSTTTIATINETMLKVPNIGQQVFYLLNTSVNALADINVHGYELPNGGL